MTCALMLAAVSEAAVVQRGGGYGRLAPSGATVTPIAAGRLASAPVYSPDGATLAWSVDSTASGSELVLRGTAPRRVPFARAIQWLAWSPRSTAIAVLANGALFVVDRKTGRVRRLSGSLPLLSGSVIWSRDGKRLAFNTSVYPNVAPTDLYIVSASGGRARKLNPKGWNACAQGSPCQVAFSPKGDRIAFGLVKPAGARRVEVERVDGTHVVVLRGAAALAGNTYYGAGGSQTAFDASGSWSADGSAILVVADTNTGRLAIARSKGGRLPLARSIASKVGFGSWSPKGASAALAGDGGAYLWKSGSARLLDRKTIRSIEWSPDGTRLALADVSEVVVVTAKTAKRTSLARWGGLDLFHGFDHSNGRRLQGGWSADSRRLAIAIGDDTTAVVDANGSGSAATTVSHVDRVAWSADHRHVAFVRWPTSTGFITPQVELAEIGSAAVRIDEQTLDQLAGISLFEYGLTSGVSWSRDGGTLAFGGHGRAMSISADGNGLAELEPGSPESLPGVPQGTGAATVSPDGLLLAWADVRGRIFVAPVDGSHAPLLLADPGTFTSEIRWSVTSDRIYVDAGAGYVLDLDGTSHPAPVGTLSPDLTAGASATTDTYGNPRGLSVEHLDGPAVTIMASVQINGWSFAWSPDSSTIAAAGVDGSSPVVVSAPADGGAMTTLGASPGTPSEVRLTWSPDSSRVVASSSTRSYIGQSGVADSLVAATGTYGPDYYAAVVWAPDSMSLVIVADAGGSLTLDAVDRDGVGSRSVQAGMDQPVAVTYAPDGAHYLIAASNGSAWIGAPGSPIVQRVAPAGALGAAFAGSGAVVFKAAGSVQRATVAHPGSPSLLATVGSALPAGVSNDGTLVFIHRLDGGLAAIETATGTVHELGSARLVSSG